MIRKICIGVYILAVLTGYVVSEKPVPMYGYIQCTKCGRILVRYDAKEGCRKMYPEFSDYMFRSLCSSDWKVPVILSCPFDGSPLTLKQEE